jgi:NAD(P)-dependent dehydrogenase (short-subunit alcohol dehydrogenase family)
MGILDRFRLDGKRALVTGAGRGIGQALAVALAEAGADVAVNDLSAETAECTAAAIRRLGRRSLAVAADVGQPDAGQRLVEAVVAEFGRLDIAVNNVGVAIPIKNSTEVTLADWEWLFNINLRGTFFCAQAEAKAMIPNRYGKIINLASICGHIVWPEWQSLYSISKAGVVHLTRCLGAEFIRHGIRVNAISPGVTRTPELFEQVIPVFLARAPIDRVASVADMQGAVVYLASEVSDFMVGQELVLDGGYTVM